MRKFLLLVLVLLGTFGYFPASFAKESKELEGFSLLFRPQEVELIREMREGGGDLTFYRGTENLLKRLYLSALIYVSETNWSLWVNGHVVRPENTLQLDPFTLVKVTPSGVQFAWHGGGKPVTFTLGINQTYDSESGAILSGDGRPSQDMAPTLEPPAILP